MQEPKNAADIDKADRNLINENEFEMTSTDNNEQSY